MNPSRRNMLSLTAAGLIHVAADPSTTAAADAVSNDLLLGSVFASTATQHGGQEATITSFHTTLLHHGMIIVGAPYTCKGIGEMDEVNGGTPYGATTLASADGSR